MHRTREVLAGAGGRHATRTGRQDIGGSERCESGSVGQHHGDAGGGNGGGSIARKGHRCDLGQRHGRDDRQRIGKSVNRQETGWGGVVNPHPVGTGTGRAANGQIGGAAEHAADILRAIGIGPCKYIG